MLRSNFHHSKKLQNKNVSLQFSCESGDHWHRVRLHERNPLKEFQNIPHTPTFDSAFEIYELSNY